MTKLFLGSGLAALIVLCFVGCEQIPVAPDIYINGVDPLAYYITDADVAITNLSVYISPKNSIDSYLDYIQWEYYDRDNNLVGSTSEPFHIYVPIPGKIDTAKSCSVQVYNLSIPIQELVIHMVRNDHFTGSVRLIFTATNELNHEEQDTASCAVGLYRLKTYKITVTSSKDSVATNDTATITANVVDNAGLPVVGDTVDFQVDLGCTVNPAQVFTDNSGNAVTTLTAGTTTGTARLTAYSRRAGFASLDIKIY